MNSLKDIVIILKYYISSLGRFTNKKGLIMVNYTPHHSGYIYLPVNKKFRVTALMFLPNLEVYTFSKGFIFKYLEENK